MNDTANIPPDSGQTPRSYRLYYQLAPAAVAFLLYLPSLFNGFTYDDKLVLSEAKGTRSFSHIAAFVTKDYYRLFGERTYRPLVSLTYLLEYQVGGLDEWLYHLTNVVLHAVCTGAVALLADSLLTSPLAACATGLLFAIHPIQGEVVNSISFREDILCGLFLAAMLYVFVRDELVRKQGVAVVVVALAAAAMLSKETAIAAAPLLACFLWLWKPADGRRRAIVAAAVAATTLGIMAYAFLLNHNPDFARPHPHAPAYADVLRTMPKVWLQYLRSIVFPVHLSVSYLPSLVKTASAPLFSLGLAFAMAWIAAIFSFRRTRPAAFGMAWTALTILPTANFLAFAVPAGELRADRFLYVPMIGIALVAGAAFEAAERRLAPSAVFRATGAALAIPAAVISIVLVLHRIPVWRDDYALFSNAARAAPRDHLLHVDLARHYESVHVREIGKARRHLEKSLRLRESPEAFVNLGKLLIEHGIPGARPAATHFFERALELNPRFVQAMNNLGAMKKIEADTLLEQAKQATEAGKLEEAERLMEESQATYRAALDLWERALEINPDFADARYQIGNLLLKLGRISEAKEVFLSTLRREPRHALSHFQLGFVLIHERNPEEGCKHLRLALRYGVPEKASRAARQMIRTVCDQDLDFEDPTESE